VFRVSGSIKKEEIKKNIKEMGITDLTILN